jgi:6-phosphogluconolactonase (cycloisomerase 2 family)
MKKTAILLSLLSCLQLHAIGCFSTKSSVDEKKIENMAFIEPVADAPSVIVPTETLVSAFTPIASIATGLNPTYVTYSHNGKFAALTNFNGASVSVYKVDQDSGQFTEIQNSPFATDSQPVWVAYSPCDTFAAVANRSGSLTAYRVHSKTGVFTRVQTLNSSTNSEINIPQSVVYSHDGRFVAVANSGNIELGIDGNVSIYKVHCTTGKLSFVQAVNLGTLLPFVVQYSPDGNFLSVTLQNAVVSNIYAVDHVTGKLEPAPLHFNTGVSPFGVAYSPNGGFAAVANPQDGTVSSYTVNEVTGAFTLSGTVAAGTVNLLVAFSNDNTLAASPSLLGGSVHLYCVDQTSGNFTAIAPIPTGLQSPVGIAFHPSKKYAAVTEEFNNLVHVYSVDTSVCQ